MDSTVYVSDKYAIKCIITKSAISAFLIKFVVIVSTTLLNSVDSKATKNCPIVTNKDKLAYNAPQNQTKRRFRCDISLIEANEVACTK